MLQFIIALYFYSRSGDVTICGITCLTKPLEWVRYLSSLLFISHARCFLKRRNKSWWSWEMLYILFYEWIFLNWLADQAVSLITWFHEDYFGYCVALPFISCIQSAIYQTWKGWNSLSKHCLLFSSQTFFSCTEENEGGSKSWKFDWKVFASQCYWPESIVHYTHGSLEDASDAQSPNLSLPFDFSLTL